MKTIEEKAKAYDEAIKVAKNNYETIVQMDEDCTFAKEVIVNTFHHIFPELKESEDEMARKELIEFVKSRLAGFPQCDKYIAWLEKQGDKDKLIQELGEYKVKYTQEVLSQYLEKQGKNEDVILADMRGEGKHKFKIGDIISNGKVVYRVDNIVKNAIGQDCYFLVNVESEKDGTRYLILTDSEGKTSHLGEITWLCEQVDKSFEKQREQKPNNKVEPKFHEGDFIVNDYCMGKVIALTDDAYLLDTGQGIPFSCEHNAHLWTIADAKDGDVLYARGNYFKEYIFLFSSFTEDNVISTHFGYDVFHETFDKKISRFGRKEDFISVTPANKEQRDLLFQKMKEAGYEWDAEKLELKKIEKKPAWGEKDDKKLNYLIVLLQDSTMNNTALRTTNEELENWLKSLKERNTWKPSDEQMKALRFVKKAKILDPEERESLNSLYIHLKRLK